MPRPAADGHPLVIKPLPLRPTIPGGVTADDCTVDTAAGRATCPAGPTVTLGRRLPGGNRPAQCTARCRTCPLRPRRTTAQTGPTITVHPHQDLRTAARQQAATSQPWQEEYRRWRPPVERAIAWLVARGHRRVPYRGVLKNDTWLHHGSP